VHGKPDNKKQVHGKPDSEKQVEKLTPLKLWHNS
jgi:hypothetical protein